MNPPVFDLARPPRRGSVNQPTDIVELQLSLEHATQRIAIRAPSNGIGRAEAVLGKKNWAAKHYWSEGEADQEITIFEFDEALPAGPVLLRIPMLATE
jgi:hypothetical protein